MHCFDGLHFPQEPELTSRSLQGVTAYSNYNLHLLLQNGRQSMHLGCYNSDALATVCLQLCHADHKGSIGCCAVDISVLVKHRMLCLTHGDCWTVLPADHTWTQREACVLRVCLVSMTSASASVHLLILVGLRLKA